MLLLRCVVVSWSFSWTQFFIIIMLPDKMTVDFTPKMWRFTGGVKTHLDCSDLRSRA